MIVLGFMMAVCSVIHLALTVLAGNYFACSAVLFYWIGSLILIYLEDNL